MLLRTFISLLTFLLFNLSEAYQNHSLEQVQNLVDIAPYGSIIEIPPGTYQGHLTIGKAVALKGRGKVTIDGSFQGTVIKVKGSGVTLEGLKIVNSGESHSNSDAAIEVSGDNHKIIQNDIKNSFFGIKVKNCKNCEIKKNSISSYREKDVADRGDALFVWSSENCVIEDNEISYVRDLSLNNSPRNLIHRNHITNSRTGLYLVFSPSTTIKNNILLNNSTGIAALYSENVNILNNQIAHNLSGNASCISTKDSSGVLIQDNELVHCGVGYLSDAPTGETRIALRRNLFSQNYLALRIYGQNGGQLFSENVFKGNLAMMQLPLDRPSDFILWQKNYWDEYEGFGRESYKNIVFADRIWMEIPQAKFFANSPFFELIDFLEKLAPFTSPHVQAEDQEPQLESSEVFLKYKESFR